MNIQGLDHIGVIVNSIEDSKPFYTEILGMKYTGKAKSEITGDAYAHFIYNNNGLDSHVELIEVSNNSPIKKAGLNQEGINHIAYRVDDIEIAIEELKRAGCEIALKLTEIGDITFAYAETGDGYIFEVMEFPSKYNNSFEVPC